jgi:glycerophosphoryl diester phosphodiesterase
MMMQHLSWDNFRSERKQRGRPFILAHRGTPTLEPENTLVSFQRALQQGADALETDLRFTKDDQLILFHDPTLERMTEGSGAVCQLRLGEIQALRTRHPDQTLRSAHVPTLLELIESTQAQIPLLLELKDPLFLQPRYAEILIRILSDNGILRKSAIVSFHFEHVQAVKAVCPKIPMGHITMLNPIPQPRAELLGPVWPLIYLNPLYVWWAHKLGKIVAPLDPRPEPRLRYYLRRGVDAILADDTASVIKKISAL